MAPLRHAHLERLMHYYHFLGGLLSEGDLGAVTSTQIASLVHMDDTLVRKDLAAIGVRGQPHVGFVDQVGKLNGGEAQPQSENQREKDEKTCMGSLDQPVKAPPPVRPTRWPPALS